MRYNVALTFAPTFNFCCHFLFFFQFLVYKASLPVCKALPRRMGIQMMLQEVQSSFKSFWNQVPRRNFFEHALTRTRKTWIHQNIKCPNFWRLLTRPIRSRNQRKLRLVRIIIFPKSKPERGKIPWDSHQLLSSLQTLDLQTHGSVKTLLVELFYP